MSGVFFSERAIRANEQAIRELFLDRQGDDSPLACCKSRIGRDLGPLLVRKMLEERNRGTPMEVTHRAMHELIGWMLATLLAGVEDEEVRMKLLGLAVSSVGHHARSCAMGEVRKSEGEAVGEIVGGHG